MWKRWFWCASCSRRAPARKGSQSLLWLNERWYVFLLILQRALHRALQRRREHHHATKADYLGMAAKVFELAKVVPVAMDDSMFLLCLPFQLVGWFLRRDPVLFFTSVTRRWILIMPVALYLPLMLFFEHLTCLPSTFRLSAGRLEVLFFELFQMRAARLLLRSGGFTFHTCSYWLHAVIAQATLVFQTDKWAAQSLHVV